MDENRLQHRVLTALVEIEKFTQSIDRVSDLAATGAPTEVLKLRLAQMLHAVATNLRIATEYIDLELERHDIY